MMHPPPTVLLFTADPTLEPLETVLQARGLAAVRVPNIKLARELLASCRDHCVAVLDTYEPASYPFRTVERLLSESPTVPTLLLLHESGPGQTPVGWTEAAAFQDCARVPMPMDALVLRIMSLLLAAGLSIPAQPTSAPRPSRQGQVVVVFGPKGGVGRSTLAANLAVGLTQLYGQETALVDSDLWFGDLRVLFDLHTDKSITSLVYRSENLDAHALGDVLIEHSSGVQILLAPPAPEAVEAIPAWLPAQAVNGYRSMFDFVVVDTHPSLEEYVLQLLEVADQVVFVTTPEVGALRRAAQVLKLAPTLGWADKVLLVLNRANSGVQLEQIERALGMRVDASIVSAGPRVVDAANRGRPALLMDPMGKEQFTRDLGHLVARIAGAPDPRWSNTARKSRWSPGWAWNGLLAAATQRVGARV